MNEREVVLIAIKDHKELFAVAIKSNTKLSKTERNRKLTLLYGGK